MRILLVGASGFLGSYVIIACAKAGIEVYKAERNVRGLDITDLDSISKFVNKIDPDCVVNCAAMTNVDECEGDYRRAKAVNAEGAGNLAKACKCRGSRLVHLSTDSVFDGKEGMYDEDSIPNPINAYAKTKLQGEVLVASLAKDYAVVRTNFYGLNPNGRHLLNWVIDSLQQKRRIVGFDDSLFNPLWAQDLALLLVELADSPYCGIIHCTGDEIYTKYAFIKKIAVGLGYGASDVEKGLSSQVKLKADRPKNTTLDNRKMHSLLKTKIHTLNEVLCDTSFDVYRTKKTGKI